MSSEVLQFGDLPDDCLLLVLDQMTPDQLFKMLRVNKKLNRFAFAKLQTNTTVMKFPTNTRSSRASRRISTDCKHLDSNPSQMLIWDSFFRKTDYQPFYDLSKRFYFFRLLSICTNVKSVDFGSCWLPDHVLVETVFRCPQIECLKVSQSDVREDEWSRVFDRIGPRIVHFAKQSTEDWDTKRLETPTLKMIAAKCPNIKQIDWFHSHLTSDLLAAFKSLPRCCRVTFGCDINTTLNFKSIFDDVFDKLIAYTLTWSAFGDRVERLSSLKFVYNKSYPVHGVEFAGLKKLDISQADFPCNYLTASRFPRLEEFCFNTSRHVSEDVYDALFQRMPSVKRLTILYNGEEETISKHSRLPKSSIHRLKNLETINLGIWCTPINWKPEGLFQQLEQYVDGDCDTKIRTLKKLIFDLRSFECDVKLRAMIEKEVERMKEKQQIQQHNRVEIDLIFKKLII